VSVVGCSPTTWLQPRAPQELKVECSVLDASVPPTAAPRVRPSGSAGVALRTHTHTQRVRCVLVGALGALGVQ